MFDKFTCLRACPFERVQNRSFEVKHGVRMDKSLILVHSIGEKLNPSKIQVWSQDAQIINFLNKTNMSKATINSKKCFSIIIPFAMKILEKSLKYVASDMIAKCIIFSVKFDSQRHQIGSRQGNLNT